jgi:hypothetical protein
MSEVHIPLPLEIADMLQDGCRDCWFGRNLVGEAIKNGLDPEPVAQSVNKECREWKGKKSPQETLINADEGPALAMSAAIDENCQHPSS